VPLNPAEPIELQPTITYKQRLRMSPSIVATSLMVGVTSSLLINPVVGNTIHTSDIQHSDNIEHHNAVNLRHTEDSDRGDDQQTLEFEEDEDKAAYHRQLEESAAQTFASFTPEKIMRAMPLELRINEEGTAFVEGPYGYLEPYAESFAKGGQQGGDTYWDQLLNVDNIMHEADIVHVKSTHRAPPPSDRLYYKILKEDGIDVNMMRNNHGLRGRRRAMRDIDMKEDYNNGVIHLDSINFRSPEEIFDEEVPDDLQDSRALQDIAPHHKTSVADQDPQENEEEISYYHNMTPHNNRQKSTYKKKVPDIRRVRPKQGTIVSNTYTFSAKVSPAQATKSPVKSVVFQLQRQDGTKSDSIDMKPIGGGIFEATVDGFNKHRGTQWCYQISVKDERSKKRRTGCTSFLVAGVGDSGSHFVNDDKEGEDDEVEKVPPAPTPTGGVKLMSQTKEVSDSNWNHGGYIAGAVGRILFKFKETGDQVFVCSGTVVKDGRDGDTSDTSDGRTIIATAAHCCYSDIYKEFASEAMFIPDQDSTRGDKSDHNCRNDRYGCWATSWAVVSDGWTKDTFPINVPVSWSCRPLITLKIRYLTSNLSFFITL